MKATKKPAKVNAGKAASSLIKLPPPGSSPKPAKDSLFTLLNPGGGEIYKVYAQYHTQLKLGPCKLRVFWKDGPYPAANLNIALIDIKNWVVNSVIASGIANVPPGEVGMVEWTLPANFLPTDDCDGSSKYPDKYGRYQIYIQGGSPLTWRYGPEFTIAWV
jgi:hypothetical protein